MTLSIAIFSDNPNITTLETTIIRAWSPVHVAAIDSFNELVGALRHYSYDLMLVNDFASVDPQKTIALIRDEVNVQDPAMLSVLVTSKATRKSVRSAVRMGYDDVLSLPFSARQLIGKVTSLAKAERSFVRVTGYFGPDRRRVDEGPPPGVVERRSTTPSNIKRVAPRVA